MVMIKEIVKKIILNRFLIDIVNFFLVKILRLKKILDSSYKKSGKFVLPSTIKGCLKNPERIIFKMTFNWLKWALIEIRRVSCK